MPSPEWAGGRQHPDPFEVRLEERGVQVEPAQAVAAPRQSREAGSVPRTPPAAIKPWA
jgi:hypothetical protein